MRFNTNAPGIQGLPGNQMYALLMSLVGQDFPILLFQTQLCMWCGRIIGTIIGKSTTNATQPAI